MKRREFIRNGAALLTGTAAGLQILKAAEPMYEVSASYRIYNPDTQMWSSRVDQERFIVDRWKITCRNGLVVFA